jgi:hypothetical protein
MARGGEDFSPLLQLGAGDFQGITSAQTRCRALAASPQAGRVLQLLQESLKSRAHNGVGFQIV